MFVCLHLIPDSGLGSSPVTPKLHLQQYDGMQNVRPLKLWTVRTEIRDVQCKAVLETANRIKLGINMMD